MKDVTVTSREIGGKGYIEYWGVGGQRGGGCSGAVAKNPVLKKVLHQVFPGL